MNYIKKNKKIILNILFSIFTYISIILYLGIYLKSYSYDFIINIIYFLILYLYFKFDKNYDKRTKRYSIILSIILSFILVVGNRVNYAIINNIINIYDLKNVFISIFIIAGFSLIFYRIFCYMFIEINKIELVDTKKEKGLSKKFFLLMVIMMVGCWGIYFLRYYPAILTPDSHYVIHYSEFKIFSDHHTFIHTWFFALFFYIGKFIFSSKIMGIAFYTIIQMILLATIFNIGINYFYKNGLKKIYCIILWLIFAFSPLHGHYSVTLWRDILFSASFLLIIISIYECTINKCCVKFKYLLYFIIGCFIMIFFRNNGIYIYIFMLPFLFIFCYYKKKRMRVLYLSILIIYFIIKGPVFDLLNVERSKTVEAYSIPLQQISRVIYSDEKLDKSTIKKLEKYMDVSKIKNNYKSYISDPIKGITNSDNLSKDSLGFLKVWVSILFKYPDTYIEAYLSQTLGYWYPSVDYWAVGTQIKSINGWETVNCHSLLSNKMTNFVDNLKNNKLPFGFFIWSIGLNVMIILFSTFILLYNREYKKLLAFVPLCALWLSIMVASPVFSELRYVYALFICAPFCLIISLINNKKRKSS